MRRIEASKELKELANKSSSKKIEIYSFFPCDKADCVCQPLVLEWKKKLAELPESKRVDLLKEQGHLECPRSRVGLKRYEIKCKACGDVLGYCFASNASLDDFCDFHYVQKVEKGIWHGCFTPHISPITQKLCLECMCGADTRDFRANMTLLEKVSVELEASNSIGRDFGKSNSKFSVRQVNSDMLPFKLEGKE